MKSVDKSKYKIYLDKGEQHKRAGDSAHKEKSYDAAVTNYSIALINFLDALSVNRFGTDLSSDNHESAPPALNKKLNQIGLTDFKPLVSECTNILKLKNTASYHDVSITAKNSSNAAQVVEKAKDYVISKLDRSI